MSIILINATAPKTSGSLTILKDCVLYIEQNTVEGNEYHLFTVIDDFDDSKNIKVHKLKVQNWLSRIQWDNGGLQRWCKKHNLEPDIIISLQNTSTKYINKTDKKIVQIVYYHQLIPLYNRSGLDHGLKLMLYHYFYPFFVSRNNTKSHYIVQLPYVKELFCRKFKNISPTRVTVIRPNKPNIDISSIEKKTFSEEKKFRFLYPATLFNYKNHEILISALVKLKKKNHNLLEKIIVIFTVDKLSKNLENNIVLNNLKSSIKLIGQVSYTELLSYYKSVDALLFPSKIESFGLPLLEASCFGLPIIAADLPYAKEVLEDYENKYFINPDNTDAWAEAIQDYEKYKKIVANNKDNCINTWSSFFSLVDKLIKEK